MATAKPISTANGMFFIASAARDGNGEDRDHGASLQAQSPV